MDGGQCKLHGNFWQPRAAGSSPTSHIVQDGERSQILSQRCCGQHVQVCDVRCCSRLLLRSIESMSRQLIHKHGSPLQRFFQVRHWICEHLQLALSSCQVCRFFVAAGAVTSTARCQLQTIAPEDSDRSKSLTGTRSCNAEVLEPRSSQVWTRAT